MLHVSKYKANSIFCFPNNASAAWNCTGFPVFYEPFFLVSFPQAKHTAMILGIPHLDFFERLISSGRNAYLHAKNVFPFSYCVFNFLLVNKILFYVLLFCFLPNCTWPTMGQKGFVLFSLSFKFITLICLSLFICLLHNCNFFRFILLPVPEWLS